MPNRLRFPSLVAVVLGVALAFGGAVAARQAGFRPIPAPDFALRDQDGRLVRLAAERGKVVIIAFLYTHCRDVCPLIADNLNQALRDLGPAGRAVRVLAVSVDPAGDTQQSARQFVEAHRLLPQFRFLIGTRQWLEPVWSAYHLVIDPTRPGTVAHSAFELLVDRHGIERASYTASVRAGAVVRDVRALQDARG